MVEQGTKSTDFGTLNYYYLVSRYQCFFGSWEVPNFGMFHFECVNVCIRVTLLLDYTIQIQTHICIKVLDFMIYNLISQFIRNNVALILLK